MTAMADPELYLALELPDVGRPEVLGRYGDDESAKLSLRYTYLGRLDPIARTIIGTGQLSWIQDVELDYAAQSGRLTYSSEDPGHRLHGHGRIAFVSDGGLTTRSIDGELVIAIPFVGGAAERGVVTGLLVRLDLEAAAIRGRLQHG